MNRLTLVVLAGALLLAVVVVLRRRGETVAMPPRAKRDPAGTDDDIDWDALERAEREVKDLEDDGSGGAPEQAPGDDWGPGAAPPPKR